VNHLSTSQSRQVIERFRYAASFNPPALKLKFEHAMPSRSLDAGSGR
jgi:hypothetical protein